MRNLIAATLVTLMPLASLAAPQQTAVLDVQNMTCGLCRVTVKKSLVNWPPKSGRHEV
jgi:mercuric ion binding protein